MNDLPRRPCPTAAGVPRVDLAALLDDEWRHLATRPANVARAGRWQLDTLPFADLHELLDLAGYDGRSRRTSDADANALLGDLVDVARFDELAGRVVLQRILPGLRAACRRWRRGCAATGVSPDEILGELVGVAWTAVRAYSTERRPRNIAYNLLGDTVYQAFVAPSRRLDAAERPRDPRHFITAAQEARRSSSQEVIDVLIDARLAGVATRHLTLLCELLNAGGSAEVVAANRGVTSRTIRTRRSRAIARVRSVATAA